MFNMVAPKILMLVYFFDHDIMIPRKSPINEAEFSCFFVNNCQVWFSTFEEQVSLDVEIRQSFVFLVTFSDLRR